MYTPEQVAKALSVKRLGGVCFINFCADGETLLLKDFDKYVYSLVKEGHYAEIVTNCTITPMIDKILSFEKEILLNKKSKDYLQMKLIVRRIIACIPFVGKPFLRSTRKCRIWLKYVYPIRKRKLFNNNIWFFLYTPTHGNLGDHAIAIAAENMFKKLNIIYFEVSFNLLEEYQSYGILNAFDGCNLVLNGGGNLGTLWMNCEQLTRDIIQSNPNSKIVILPNSFYYDNTKKGQEELKKSIQIYNKHEHLYLFAREKLSFEAMQGIYNNVFLVPDMVFSLDYSIDESIEREGILVCLRNDIERTMLESDRIKLEKLLASTSLRVTFTDTVLSHNIDPEDRKKEVYNKLSEFNKAQIVITDRLHGMIFSAITGTPCIVINSMSPKIRGCMEWVKTCDYIKYTDDIDAIHELLPEIINRKNDKVDISEEKYAKVWSVLKEF